MGIGPKSHGFIDAVRLLAVPCLFGLAGCAFGPSPPMASELGGSGHISNLPGGASVDCQQGTDDMYYHKPPNVEIHFGDPGSGSVSVTVFSGFASGDYTITYDTGSGYYSVAKGGQAAANAAALAGTPQPAGAPELIQDYKDAATACNQFNWVGSLVPATTNLTFRMLLPTRAPA